LPSRSDADDLNFDWCKLGRQGKEAYIISNVGDDRGNHSICR